MTNSAARDEARKLMDEALDRPFTFDLLRDPDWQPTREHYAALREAAEARVVQLQQERDQLAEALEQNGVDARWIVGQWQRLRDEPVKKVALDIVTRVDAALAASRRAGE